MIFFLRSHYRGRKLFPRCRSLYSAPSRPGRGGDRCIRRAGMNYTFKKRRPLLNRHFGSAAVMETPFLITAAGSISATSASERGGGGTTQKGLETFFRQIRDGRSSIKALQGGWSTSSGQQGKGARNPLVYFPLGPPKSGLCWLISGSGCL